MRKVIKYYFRENSAKFSASYSGRKVCQPSEGIGHGFIFGLRPHTAEDYIQLTKDYIQLTEDYIQLTKDYFNSG